MIQVETFDGLLQYAVSHRASDLHLAEGMCPMMRVDGDLALISDTPFGHDQIRKILSEHLSEERFKIFEKEKELDYSFGVQNLGRFRANLFYHKGSVGCAIRALPFDPMNFDEIGFPAMIAENLSSKPSGLVLVTGATGSGKTTTLAAMLDHINRNQNCHIVTVEDPIEFVFKNKRSIIHQREVGADTHSFAESLKHVLRQDPDVILIGEMRDLETIEIALTVAETGHLVFATLHTPDAVQSVNRIIDVFPAHQQQQVRVQVSFVLQAVICQQLLPRIGGGLALASEIMLANPAIRNLIRESKSHQIYSTIQMGQKEGMRTLNMSLAELVRTNKVTRESAISRSADVPELERLLASK
ncbi:MAG: type IV pili twitching motility protein PilT [Candidatus Omnitrophica bacterium CG07_land_8_20_14_0_80_50_8]|nr:MAG: type IV pili twitching motility protein PilT [Candidatus Omnitrophica bacterium CG07_land_8_20_14_0_80_50_8]